LIFTCSVPNFLHLEACGITIWMRIFHRF
jgi:hypothetical protein